MTAQNNIQLTTTHSSDARRYVSQHSYWASFVYLCDATIRTVALCLCSPVYIINSCVTVWLRLQALAIDL